MKAIKVTVNLPEDVVNAVREMATLRKTTMTEVIRDAISNDYYLEREFRKGSKVLLERRNGKFRQVVFPWMHDDDH